MSQPDELVEIFRAEARGQLEEIFAVIEQPPERWALPRLFALLHNVKGTAAIVGAEEIRIIAHGAEEALGYGGDVALTSEVAELVREGASLLEALLDETPPPAELLFDYAERTAALMVASPGVGDPGQTGGGLASEVLDERSEGPADEPAPASAELAGAAAASTIRVAAAKIDSLVGLATEVMIQTLDGEGRTDRVRRVLRRLRGVAAREPELRAQLSEPLRALADVCEELVEGTDRARRISDELNASVRGLRMVRLEGLREIFTRVIRESCDATGKRGRLEFATGAIEIDRELLDQLRDPLVHLLRNAVAHGIEAPSERARAGKPALGVIEVSARAAGPWVEITIADDGGGISAEAIGRRAVEQGLLDEEALARLSESERLALVFMARLSTQRTPNTIAGRGVGLDVARTRIHGCGGRISVRSALGQGTSFEIQVPLTRATTRGVVVRAARQRYILPALYVDRVLMPRAADLAARGETQHDASLGLSAEGGVAETSSTPGTGGFRLLPLDENPGARRRAGLHHGLLGQLEGKPVVRVAGETLRVTDLLALLGLPPRALGERPIVILNQGQRRRGVVVDEVLEEREFVLQGLGWNLAAVRGVAGSAVLDGGDIVLVLDAPAVIDGLESSALDTRAEVGRKRRRRILVVDDSVTSRTLEKNILSSAGYEVLVAVDGVEAWRTLEAEAIDLVISDVEMPNMDGLALTRKIREVERHASTPIILVTSRGSPQDRLLGAEAGADAYVVKGAFDQDELLRAVARLL